MTVCKGSLRSSVSSHDRHSVGASLSPVSTGVVLQIANSKKSFQMKEGFHG
jgi:hypothetical protein